MAQRTGLIALAAMTTTSLCGFGRGAGVPRPTVAYAARLIQTSGGLGFPLRDVGSIRMVGLATIRLGPQTKEPRPVPSGAGNENCDFGEIGVGQSVVGKPVCQHHDAVALALPLPDQNRTRLDPAWQHDFAVRLRDIRLRHLIEQALRRAGEATIAILLNPMRDTASEQIRAERFRRIAAKHLPIPETQLSDRHDRQPIQLALDGWIGGLDGRGLLHG